MLELIDGRGRVGPVPSLGEARTRELEERGAVLERNPVRKDKMDGHLAVMEIGRAHV